MTNNPYLTVIYQNLPRLFALYNQDQSDPFYGCGDKRYWGWKLMDFPNATYQGACLGLARLYKADMLPEHYDKQQWLERIVAMITVLPKLMDRRGGLAEALPYEGSFCVTGLVLGDVLGAIKLLGDEISQEKKQELIQICSPMASFLKKQDESHGIISNHLATSALGMVRWAVLTGDKSALDRASLWINRIKANSSPEGWMSEYDGADPGYQSWCSTSLAQIEQETDQFNLKPLLASSYQFLSAFAMPDGSFSNGCGNRMTRFFFPGSAELYAEHNQQAANLALFSQTHLAKHGFVTLNSIDEPNLIPFFNDIVLAAIHYKNRPDAQVIQPESCFFKEAGLMIHNGSTHVSTINIKRGGWISSIPKAGQSNVQNIQSETLVTNQNNKLFCAHQGKLTSQSETILEIESDLISVERMMPSAFKFLILRVLSLSLFQSLALGNVIKKKLAKMLLSKSPKSIGTVKRRLNLETRTIEDTITSSENLQLIKRHGFSPKHMASQGYWQVSDDTKT